MMYNFNVKGKVVVVTGGASSILLRINMLVSVDELKDIVDARRLSDAWGQTYEYFIINRYW